MPRPLIIAVLIAALVVPVAAQATGGQPNPNTTKISEVVEEQAAPQVATASASADQPFTALELLTPACVVETQEVTVHPKVHMIVSGFPITNEGALWFETYYINGGKIVDRSGTDMRYQFGLQRSKNMTFTFDVDTWADVETIMMEVYIEVEGHHYNKLFLWVVKDPTQCGLNPLLTKRVYLPTVAR